MTQDNKRAPEATPEESRGEGFVRAAMAKRSARLGHEDTDYETLAIDFANIMLNLYSQQSELMGALKYARRFLKKTAHDTDYVDSAIARSEGYRHDHH